MRSSDAWLVPNRSIWYVHVTLDFYWIRVDHSLSYMQAPLCLREEFPKHLVLLVMSAAGPGLLVSAREEPT
jgi:hypothetical protein